MCSGTDYVGSWSGGVLSKVGVTLLVKDREYFMCSGIDCVGSEGVLSKVGVTLLVRDREYLMCSWTDCVAFWSGAVLSKLGDQEYLTHKIQFFLSFLD
jgi:hypothetical protein